MRFLPGGRLIAVNHNGVHGRAVALWDWRKQVVERYLLGCSDGTIALDVDSRRRVLVAANRDAGSITAWNYETGKRVFCTRKHRECVWSVAVSKDGRHFASASQDGTIGLWDLPSGSRKAVLGRAGPPVNAVEFTADGKMLVSGGNDKLIRLWAVSEKSLVAALKGNNDIVMAVATSPDGRMLASAGFDGTLRIWRVQN